VVGYGYPVVIDLLVNKVLRVPWTTGHSRDKTSCDIFQEGSVGQNGGITKAFLDHALAPPDLVSWLEHEEVEPQPTHPGRASIRNRRTAQGKGGSMDTSSVIEESGRLLYVGSKLCHLHTPPNIEFGHFIYVFITNETIFTNISVIDGTHHRTLSG